ncbi:MAG TPA: DUF1501 domain-containing protein [Deltaproteobacteria bacterium]|nr:DUF1501 domain-containing protein [Deltaproteobacteria bacterium]
MRRAVLGVLGVLGVLTAAGAVTAVGIGLARRGGAARQLNVLIIVWDTVRADRLSLYGHDRPTTPRLDARAEQGVVFEAASSPGIWTLPSHASLFTGLAPESTGASERWLWLDGHHLTLAEHFAEHGYATFSMAANALLCGETNLVQGFRVPMNTYRGKVAPLAKAATQAKLVPGDVSQELAPGWRPPEHGATNAEWGRAIYKDAAPLIGRTFLAWLDRRSDPEAPFFAYLNFMEAHTPRIPSMASRRAVLGDEALIQRGLQTDAAHIRLHFYSFGKQEYSPEQIEAIRGVYDASLRDLDEATGQLLDALERRGRLEDTVVVLTSDHGENLGDHGLFNHRFALWRSLARVPLVLWHPELSPRRIETPVTTRDLFPTLSRLAGLPPPPLPDAGDLLLRPSPAITYLAKPLRREIETVASVYPEVRIEPWMRSGHALDDGDRRLIAWDDGQLQLFDPRADPGELQPLDEPGRAAALHDRLEAYREQVPPYDPTQRGPGDDPVHVRASQEELRAQLEALGYTTDDEAPP